MHSLTCGAESNPHLDGGSPALSRTRSRQDRPGKVHLWIRLAGPEGAAVFAGPARYSDKELWPYDAKVGRMVGLVRIDWLIKRQQGIF